MSASDGLQAEQPRDEYCARCGAKMHPLGFYCPNCGADRGPLGQAGAPQQGPPTWPTWTVLPAPTPVKKAPSWRITIKTILAFGMLTFLAQLVISLFTLVYGTTIVLPEIVQPQYSYVLYVVAPIIFGIGELSGEALGAYYLLLVAAILASAVWFFVTSAKDFLKELSARGQSRKHSAVFDLCGLMFGVLFLNYVVILFMSLFWESPTVPTEGAEVWELLFVLANASVWEELVVRVLLIGVPLLLVDLLRHAPREKMHRYILGGGFTLGVAEVVMLLASSALFGYAHYDGWGAWKIFPSAVAGVAFGYMFLKHGLASAIMLHFGFDYLSMPTEVFVQGSDLWAMVLLGFALLAWAAMGAVFFGYYVTRMIEFVTKEKYFEDGPPVLVTAPSFYTYRYRPPPPDWQTSQQPEQRMEDRGRRRSEVTVSPAQPGFGGFFVCPMCGHTGARWVDGKFQCLRCGAIV